MLGSSVRMGEGILTGRTESLVAMFEGLCGDDEEGACGRGEAAEGLESWRDT